MYSIFDVSGYANVPRTVNGDSFTGLTAGTGRGDGYGFGTGSGGGTAGHFTCAAVSGKGEGCGNAGGRGYGRGVPVELGSKTIKVFIRG